MAKKQYKSPMAKLSRLSNEDIITNSGWADESDGTRTMYSSFDSSWLPSSAGN